MCILILPNSKYSNILLLLFFYSYWIDLTTLCPWTNGFFRVVGYWKCVWYIVRSSCFPFSFINLRLSFSSKRKFRPDVVQRWCNTLFNLCFVGKYVPTTMCASILHKTDVCWILYCKRVWFEWNDLFIITCTCLNTLNYQRLIKKVCNMAFSLLLFLNQIMIFENGWFDWHMKVTQHHC